MGMFGPTVDYYILRPLAHSRNLAFERERSGKPPHYGLKDARAYAEKARTLYFGNELPIDAGLSYLDMGCGAGELSIGLSLQGVTDIVGIDMVDQNVTTAKTVARQLPVGKRPEFLKVGSEDFAPERRFDVVFGLAVMEHTDAPAAFLRRVHDLLTPSGHAFVSMTPFHGPFGDHMSKVFRVQLPWRGVLFSEEAILRLRRERYRPNEATACYQDIAGGLNLMRVGEYIRYIEKADLSAVHRFDPHFRHYPRYWPLVPISFCLTKIPLVRDYCTMNVFSILRRGDGSVFGQ